MGSHKNVFAAQDLLLMDMNLMCVDHPVDRQIELDGCSLTIDRLVKVSRDRVPVRISDQAMCKVRRSHSLLLKAASCGHVIYGLNRGVGQNKDQQIFANDRFQVTQSSESASFNLKMLRSHQASIGPEVSEERVRAAMVARLNTMLLGTSGCHPKVVAMYAEFLNCGIHPILQSRGSVGEADITILPSIGLAMAGEGDVRFRGRRLPASEAMAIQGLNPLIPIAKDALAILSSNAYAAGFAALTLADLQVAIDVHKIVYALSLEGLNGNLAPLVAEVQRIRPFTHHNRCAQFILELLEGSYLQDEDPQRALQDPLSFRVAANVLGETERILTVTRNSLGVQLNSSEDNPGVILDASPGLSTPRHLRRNYFESESDCGMVVPTANFEPIGWVLSLESLCNSVAHVINMSCQRVLRLGSSKLTSLSRHLRVDEVDHGLASVEKTCASLRAEAVHLAQPVSLHGMVTSGGVEDISTNSAQVVSHLERLTAILNDVSSLELYVASQAVSLRIRANGKDSVSLGRETGWLYATFREHVPIYECDSAVTQNLIKSRQFVAKLPARENEVGSTGNQRSTLRSESSISFPSGNAPQPPTIAHARGADGRGVVHSVDETGAS